jgi:hypothetical protein
VMENGTITKNSFVATLHWIAHELQGRIGERHWGEVLRDLKYLKALWGEGRELNGYDILGNSIEEEWWLAWFVELQCLWPSVMRFILSEKSFLIYGLTIWHREFQAWVTCERPFPTRNGFYAVNGLPVGKCWKRNSYEAVCWRRYQAQEISCFPFHIWSIDSNLLNRGFDARTPFKLIILQQSRTNPIFDPLWEMKRSQWPIWIEKWPIKNIEPMKFIIFWNDLDYNQVCGSFWCSVGCLDFLRRHWNDISLRGCKHWGRRIDVPKSRIIYCYDFLEISGFRVLENSQYLS